MPDLRARLIETPGAKLFQERLHDDMSARNCVIIMLPATVPYNVIWMLIHDCLGKTFDICEVELPSLLSQYPSAELGKLLEDRWGIQGSPRTLATLVNATSMPDILHLSGFEELDKDKQRIWLNFVKEWADYTPSIKVQFGNPTAICLPIQAFELKIPEPISELNLKVRSWWGIPSTSDLRLLCNMEHIANEKGMNSLWRENLLISLSGTDINFAEFLWDKMELSWEELITKCREYATMRGWTSQLLAELNCGSLQEHSYYPTIRNVSQPVSIHSKGWAYGILSSSPDYGLEIHSAVIASLNFKEEFRKRVWRAQVGLIMPILEAHRLNLCRILTDSYGSGWPTKWQQPLTEWERDATLSNPNTCEFGHLKSLLHQPELNNHRHNIPSVLQANWIRNDIAHGKPILYCEFVRLIELMSSI